MSREPVPHSLTRNASELLIEWRQGDQPQRLSSRALRIACPCAGCRDEMTGRRILDPDSVAYDIRLTGLELVGTYGVRLLWSDGHHTGIFTFSALAEMAVTD